ncbi:MAG: THUMP domain-containing class I SAM-dependent RNA methyltransferase [Gemmatimonadaceae bacterium]
MARSDSAPAFELFAVCAPGLEALVAAELGALGATPGVTEPGGFAFSGDEQMMFRANLHARIASRIMARVGHFRARALSELERRAKQLAWERYLAPGTAVQLRVTCRKSKLYHSGAVAERIVAAIAARAERVGGVTHIRASGIAAGDDEGDDTAVVPHAQLFVVRVLHDECSISVDTSGALLHRRGYREATAKAPMRETLAAALLVAGGWDPSAPLLDPMCGAGTIAIEGALLSRRIAPGIRRSFACVQWPGADTRAWQALLDRAHGAALPRSRAPILASDRDAGAVEAARANAERAGVAGDIEFSRRALSAVTPPDAPGWLVTNPPYGKRIGDAPALRDLYATLGRVARRGWPGSTLVVLSADRVLERQLGLECAPLLRTRNGGIAVRVMRCG